MCVSFFIMPYMEPLLTNPGWALGVVRCRQGLRRGGRVGADAA
jgi:hypothetical protein